jgi:hypothetical protein
LYRLFRFNKEHGERESVKHHCLAKWQAITPPWKRVPFQRDPLHQRTDFLQELCA